MKLSEQLCLLLKIYETPSIYSSNILKLEKHSKVCFVLTILYTNETLGFDPKYMPYTLNFEI